MKKIKCIARYRVWTRILRWTPFFGEVPNEGVVHLSPHCPERICLEFFGMMYSSLSPYFTPVLFLVKCSTSAQKLRVMNAEMQAHQSNQHCVEFRWTRTSTSPAQGPVHSAGCIYFICITCSMIVKELHLYGTHRRGMQISYKPTAQLGVREQCYCTHDMHRWQSVCSESAIYTAVNLQFVLPQKK